MPSSSQACCSTSGSAERIAVRFAAGLGGVLLLAGCVAAHVGAPRIASERGAAYDYEVQRGVVYTPAGWPEALQADVWIPRGMGPFVRSELYVVRGYGHFTLFLLSGDSVAAAIDFLDRTLR